jgi:hypothetical protein
MFKLGFKIAAGAYVGWQAMSMLDGIVGTVINENKDRLVRGVSAGLEKFIFGKK